MIHVHSLGTGVFAFRASEIVPDVPDAPTTLPSTQQRPFPEHTGFVVRYCVSLQVCAATRAARSRTSGARESMCCGVGSFILGRVLAISGHFLRRRVRLAGAGGSKTDTTRYRRRGEPGSQRRLLR